MSGGHTVSTKPPFDDLMDVMPLIKDCKTNKTKCACTDPSFNYSTPCKINPVGSNAGHSGRKQCTYGGNQNTGSSGGSYENSVSNSTKSDNKDFTFQVGTNTNRATFDPTSNTLGFQPRSILFCANPDPAHSSAGTDAGALPTQTKSQVTSNNSGGVNPNSWSQVKPGSDNQPNLGFDKN